MDGFVRFLAGSVGQLLILAGKTEGRFSPLFKILVHIYLDSNLFFEKREITEYYKLDALNIFFRIRRYQISFVQIRTLRIYIYYFKATI